MIFNEFEDNFVCACNFPSELSLFTDHLFTQSLEVFRISVNSSFLEGKLPVPGCPTVLITVGQGPTALAVGAGGDCLDILLSSIRSLLFLPLFGRRPDID